MSNINEKIILDTNILLRFLLEDEPKQADQAEEILNSSKHRSIYVPDLVIAEIAYVLGSKTYNFDREIIADALDSLISFPQFILNKKHLVLTNKIFRANRISFTDAYLLACSNIRKDFKTYTFDKKMLKVKGCNVVEP